MSLEPSELTSATVLDPVWYVDPALHEFDQSHILAHHWQVVAPVSAVAGLGDSLARHIAGVPIALVRTEDGLRGYLNICPHRAGPVVPCDARGQSQLRCGYHGWTYNLQGQLINAPRMREADQFNEQDVRLQPIDTMEWGGMVFARLEGTLPFADWLQGLNTLVPEHTLSEMEHRISRVYDVDANWKLYVDNFLEGYHLPFVHPDLTQVVDFPNYVTELGRWWSVQRSPVPADSGAYAAGEAFYFFVYPNTMLNVMPGRLQTNRVIALGHDRCRVEFDFYYDAANAHRQEEDVRFTEQVQEEDRVVCEHVQAGYASGRYRPGRLSPARESAVHHWQNLLRDAYRQAADLGT